MTGLRRETAGGSPTGVYHDFDDGLFYVAIRENAALRVATFEKAH